MPKVNNGGWHHNDKMDKNGLLFLQRIIAIAKCQERVR